MVAAHRGGAAAMVEAEMVEGKARQAREEAAKDAQNPFSAAFDKSGSGRLKKGDAGYGLTALDSGGATLGSFTWSDDKTGASLRTFLELHRVPAKDAEALLAVGESARSDVLVAPEHAAWTVVCGTVLNLSEAVTRG